MQFKRKVWNFYKKNKRDFPWRNTTDPYKILVSEVMLQQTQAERVIEYYARFLKRFPSFKSLSRARFGDVYEVWQGLGYNRRAMALKKTAEAVLKEHQGKLPTDHESLVSLPGIGPYTANAIMAFSWNKPVVCIETNIRRVYIHHFFPKKKVVREEDISRLASQNVSKEKSREWHWALMDYGAFLKSYIQNPNRRHKDYIIQSKFEGSNREIRGLILKNLAKNKMTFPQLVKVTQKKVTLLKKVLVQLEKEALVGYHPAQETFHLN